MCLCVWGGANDKMAGSMKGGIARLQALPAEHQDFQSSHRMESKYITSTFASTHGGKEKPLEGGLDSSVTLQVTQLWARALCQVFRTHLAGFVTAGAPLYPRCIFIWGWGGGCISCSEELDCHEDKALLLSASSSERHLSSYYMNCICKKGRRQH